MPSPFHYALGVFAFVALMLIGGAIVLTANLANSIIPLSDPWPFLIWAVVWYLFSVLCVWIADRVGV